MKDKTHAEILVRARNQLKFNLSIEYSNLARFLIVCDIRMHAKWPVYVNFVFVQLH